ncbi:cell wall-binding repeat-containing protein [Oceanobacillus chungangensis]|uniref:SH3b domain-containing protein n=1 Tax=Oceanobacillus chungangensis TaxID=1229152 RepID=A0A3D8PH86_9BACI|nr:cell wall-binding repeat-containing protein [Oceanobacillus chungangensis]RDW15443.1 hypothetical protein CWR45_16800 [Oceanobacillus chungangensis]
MLVLRKRSQLVLLAVLLAFFVVLPMYVGAEEATKFDFSIGEAKEQLTETKEVHVTNQDMNAALSITANGQELYHKELPMIKLTSIEKVIVDDQEFAIIGYRHDGSANGLYFEILKLNESTVETVYTSDVYERARMEISENQITLEYPKYEEEDARTEPSAIITEEFSITDNKVVEGKSEVEQLEYATNSLQAEGNAVNPSFSQINKILTEESLKANVSPEIVKAIALQESGWEQYWGSVPKSIQACENYDGTNVKLGYDCIGIGIMQISNQMYMKDGPEKDAYIDRLKTDIRFNIQEGIKILKDKWNYHKPNRYTGISIIPTINDNDPLVIENWYFAVMAYNGMLPRNNPLERPFSPYGAYQEEVFELLNDYTLIDINPFPTHKLDPYTLENGQVRFKTTNFSVSGPQHYSSQSLVKGDTAYTTAQTLNIRNAPNGDVIGSLPKGSKVTITGSYAGNNSRYSQYVWLPIRTSTGKNAWVSSSYLNKQDYIDVHRLEGYSRYDTSVSIANHGWHWNQPTSVVIGRGDDPIDALTGSVLASGLDSPLMLTQTKELPLSVERELDRLNPTGIIYILGGKNVISVNVENKLKRKFGNNKVKRISGYSRFDTASQVANEVDKQNNVSEIIVTTGDSNSSDPLAIAPYAGENNIPILLTGRSKGESLNPAVKNFIQEKGIKKVTIIGGNIAVSKKAETELQRLVGAANVKRVFGKSRFDTNIAIINTFYNSKAIDKLLVSQGMQTADALSASPFAAKLEAPIVLTQANKLPAETNAWLNGKITTRPNLYFLGGNVAINEKVRNEIVKLVR